MPSKRQAAHKEYTDYEANFRHYQDINSQIERKTSAVFETANKLKNAAEQSKAKELNTPERGVAKNRCCKELPTSSGLLLNSASNGDPKNQALVDLNQQLKAAQNELEFAVLKQKQLEAEKEQQRQELVVLKGAVKKLKSTVHAKHLVQEAQKKEIGEVLNKLKAEEEFKKALHKEVERLTKQLSIMTAEKEKAEEKTEKVKTDFILLKQRKMTDNPGIKVSTMLKCIRKQAILIDNLTQQITQMECAKAEAKAPDLIREHNFSSGLFVG